MDILTVKWNPVLNLITVLKSVESLLSEEFSNSKINEKMVEKLKQKAKCMVKKYAKYKKTEDLDEKCLGLKENNYINSESIVNSENIRTENIQ